MSEPLSFAAFVEALGDTTGLRLERWQRDLLAELERPGPPRLFDRTTGIPAFGSHYLELASRRAGRRMQAAAALAAAALHDRELALIAADEATIDDARREAARLLELWTHHAGASEGLRAGALERLDALADASRALLR